MGVIVRKIGTQIEIRHHDVPLFDRAKADAVMVEQARILFDLALQEIAGHISDEAPVGVSGHLAQSWGATPATADGGIEVTGSTLGSLEGRVFSNLPYAIVIDQGRAPGRAMPPIDAIMLWAERVLGIRDSDDFELEDAAWAIAMSIARKGIQARRFVERGLAAAMPRVDGIFEVLADVIAVALVDPNRGAGGATAGPGGVGL